MPKVPQQPLIKSALPVLKWAGGKRWFVKYVDQFLPQSFNNYHEPFIGGASIFLHLKNTGKIKHKSFLSDFNSELINTYRQLQLNPQKVVEVIKSFKNEMSSYYTLRSLQIKGEIENAAKFIFLNKTSFNGIYRVNKKGEYNVPYGYRTGDNIFDYENIIKTSLILNDNTEFLTGDFDLVRENIQKNDLVFLDPPYTVAHENNGFIQYNKSLFSWNDQERLAELLKFISAKGAHFIMTNAAHKNIEELFDPIGKKVQLDRKSLVGGKGAVRKNVHEFIFTNIN